MTIEGEQMTDKSLDVYFDYKSPYAYLAVAQTWELERDFAVQLNWLPYTLNIPDFLGSAKVAADGEVMEADRSEHQWRRVRYSYMDVRRYANLRGLTVRGPQKIWDSSLAGIGMLYAKTQDAVRAYTDITYDRFWKRELDIEDREVLRAVLAEAGADTAGWDAYLDGEGRAEHDRIRAEAEERGIFGVPSYVIDDELFWGREHLSMVRLRLAEQGLARPGIKVDVPHALR
jgi:2-hydroxychromene-2-carboxylate isomerase